MGVPYIVGGIENAISDFFHILRGDDFVSWPAVRVLGCRQIIISFPLQSYVAKFFLNSQAP